MKLGTLIGAVMLFGGGCIFGLVIGAKWNYRVTDAHLIEIKSNARHVRRDAKALESVIDRFDYENWKETVPDLRTQINELNAAIGNLDSAVYEAEKSLGR